MITKIFLVNFSIPEWGRNRGLITSGLASRSGDVDACSFSKGSGIRGWMRQG